MHIKILSVGKIKEKYLQEAVKEYEKRLSRFCTLEITELQAEEILDDSMCEKYKKIEGERILKHLKDSSFIITLEISGKSFSSTELAQEMKTIFSLGHNEIIFIIGGANGLSSEVSSKANLKLSFSKMTFTHQLMKVILLEQLYRCFKINANESYHR